MPPSLTVRRVVVYVDSCCSSSSSSSCPAGSWLHPPGPSSVPGGSGRQHWAEPRWCLWRPWTHHSYSDVHSLVGRSSTQNAWEGENSLSTANFSLHFYALNSTIIHILMSANHHHILYQQPQMISSKSRGMKVMTCIENRLDNKITT